MMRHFRKPERRVAPVITDKIRKGAIAKVKIAQAQLRMDDGAYREMLMRVTGCSSSTDCTVEQLGLVIEEMKRLGFKDKPRGPARAGDRRLAGGEQQAKIRALWLALYHLGEVRDPAESALANWVKRVARIADLAWLGPDDANKAIEGLKAWCLRVGYKVPETAEDAGLQAKRDLCKAIWKRVGEAGGAIVTHEWALNGWASKIKGCSCALEHLDLAQLDELVERLGAKLRRDLAGQATRA